MLYLSYFPYSYKFFALYIFLIFKTNLGIRYIRVD